MSDKLKKFIQRSKTEFDQESPRSDLFDKIMDKVDHNKIGVNPPVNFKYSFQWIAVAASLLLLLCLLENFQFCCVGMRFINGIKRKAA